jgi:hypothetical protein
VQCPDCNGDYVTLVVKIRAKRSRGNRKWNNREFDIRVIRASGREEVIQFCNAAYRDFELRQGDEAAFYYVRGRLHSVHNFTVDEYYELSSSRCYLATYVYGEESQQAEMLRRFRDSILLKRFSLIYFVHLYYWLSPIVIRRFGHQRFFRIAARIALAPLLWALHPMNIGGETLTGVRNE